MGRWNKQTSDLAVLGYKMLVQTGNPDDPIDTSRVGCSNPALANCDRVCVHIGFCIAYFIIHFHKLDIPELQYKTSSL